MTHSINLTNTKLSDILRRLDDREQNIFAIKSFSSQGWGNVLAWNPVAVFNRDTNNREDTIIRLEEFVSQQQALGRQMIGYLSYDFGRQLHSVESSSEDDLGVPLLLVASFNSWISFDNDAAEIHSADPLFIRRVKEITKRPLTNIPQKLYKQPLRPTRSRSSYAGAYNKVQNYIKAGDVYQVNLTHRLEGTTTAKGNDLFCLLSQQSEADFQAYISADNFEVLSFSPERFINVKQQQIVTSPIKGTRARSTDALEDKALQEDLLNNPKDKAELNMITDLMRNDLGAICEIGSVKVTSKRILKQYPTLWHAHSTIKGKLRSDINPITALANLMPGGSITGSPKKRAIEIIDELELKQRNIYTGSIFTIKPDGELDSSIAIRTMIKKSDRLYLSVGGGIVYGSTESDEYQESVNKAASFMEIASE